MAVRFREPAHLRCKICDEPYQLSWRRFEEVVATLVLTCGGCKAVGTAKVDRSIAMQTHLLRPGSDDARTLMAALEEAAVNAHMKPEES